MFHTVTEVGSSLIVAGGVDSNWDYLDSVEILSSVGGEWTTQTWTLNEPGMTSLSCRRYIDQFNLLLTRIRKIKWIYFD